MKTGKSEDPLYPEFEPDKWNNKEFEWHGRLFIRRAVPQIFHCPIPGFTDRTIRKLKAEATEAHALPDGKDYLMLTHDCSPWISHYYLLVTKPVPNADDHALAGKFMTRVFEGPARRVSVWTKQMKSHAAEKGKEVIRWYYYFAGTRKCMGKSGHNYVVIFAQTM